MHRKHDLGLDAFDDNTYDVTRGEMGLLDTLTWFYEQPDLCVAEYCEITPNRVPDHAYGALDNPAVCLYGRQR